MTRSNEADLDDRTVALVMCDGTLASTCDEEVVLYGAEATIRQVRAEARRRGRSYRRGLDLCPNHRTAGPTGRTGQMIISNGVEDDQ